MRRLRLVLNQECLADGDVEEGANDSPKGAMVIRPVGLVYGEREGRDVETAACST